MHDFTPLAALAGGALIGLSASVLLLFNGRIAGVSGIYASAVGAAPGDRAGSAAFILGLLAVGLAVRAFAPALLASSWLPSGPLAVVAGLVVGVGPRLGGGCTSGHGVCGLSRLSVRSLVATATFIAAGSATVVVVRHLLAGTG